jgi:regulator of sigma E protease
MILATIFAFIIVLGLLIFVHELGHFIAAKKSGMRVEEFGFGFPPRILGIKKGETTYSLNLIPIGGFVKILGENGEEKTNPRSFAHKPLYLRFITLAAGVFMNFVLAACLLSINNFIGTPTVIEDGENNLKDAKIQISAVTADSPAKNSNLKIGDIISSIDGQIPQTTEDVSRLIREKKGKEITLVITRGDDQIEKKITPRESYPENDGPLGIGIVKTALVSYPWYQAIYLGVKDLFLIFGQIFVGFFTILKTALSGGSVGAEIAGPVGIAVLTNQVTEMGLSYLIQFTAIFSINIGILNALPFPALDGGRILFLAIEKIRKKPISQKVEQIIHTSGFLLLILLMLVITVSDTLKFKQNILGFFKNFF